MLPVCTSVAAVPASARRHKSLASLSWLGWAELGWAGSELSPASQCPAQASQDGGSVMAQRGAESSSVVSLIWTLHSDMLHTPAHCPLYYLPPPAISVYL